MERVFIKTVSVQDCWSVLKTIGWREATVAFTKWAKLILFNSAEFIILAHSLGNLGDIPEPRISIEFRQGTLQDIDKLGNVAPLSHSRYYQYLFTCSGLFCFVAIHEEKIVAFFWTSTATAPDRERYQLPLTSWEAYIHNSHTAAEYRHLGIMSALITYGNMWLRDKGYRRIITLVSTNNAISLAMMRKLGFQNIGRLKHRRILWWEKRETKYGSAP